jgi:hypothetical protein
VLEIVEAIMCALFRLGLLLLFFGFHSGAIAQNTKQVELGVGVFCDSAEKMERFLTLHKGEIPPPAAIQAVNSETTSRGACGMASILFLPGDNVGNVNVSGGIMRIVQITVIAIKMPQGWLDVPQAQQYTAFFEKAEAA